MLLAPRIACAAALAFLGCSEAGTVGQPAGAGGRADDATAGNVAASGQSSSGASAGAPSSGGLPAGGGVAGAGGGLGGGSGDGNGGDGDSAGAGSDLPLLDGTLSPAENFDLTTWSITFPDASQEMEAWLAAGGERPDVFYTDAQTGGMVFRVPNLAETTANSSYSRTELREMLRAGNTDVDTRGLNANNWVFSSSTPENQETAGGVDGTLRATLRVDHVSTTGDAAKVGRVIVGQIHASENEPCRLYYRKLPGNSRGSLYFAHDPNEGAETFVELVGSRENDAADPPDGLALGEPFSYTIEVSKHDLSVTISRAAQADVTKSIDMSASAFADDWMYFKAGAYNQNNSGSSEDYAQVTFFALKAAHE
jgi:hypothetical protein